MATNFKEIRRVKIPLEAKSYEEFLSKQLELQKALDKPFEFTDVRAYFDKAGNVIRVVGWYYDTLKPNEVRPFK